MPKWLDKAVADVNKNRPEHVDLDVLTDALDQIVNDLRDKQSNMQEKFPQKADGYGGKADEIETLKDELSEAASTLNDKLDELENLSSDIDE